MYNKINITPIIFLIGKQVLCDTINLNCNYDQPKLGHIYTIDDVAIINNTICYTLAEHKIYDSANEEIYFSSKYFELCEENTNTDYKESINEMKNILSDLNISLN